MSRPSAIVAFERLYLASIAVYTITAIAFWSRTLELAQASTAAGPSSVQSLVGPIMIGTLTVTVVASVLFWWLVARQRSEVGKWLVVVTEAIGALLALWSLAQLVRGASVNSSVTALNLISTVLGVAAAAMLLRGDAAAWFRGGDDLQGPLA